VHFFASLLDTNEDQGKGNKKVEKESLKENHKLAIFENESVENSDIPPNSREPGLLERRLTLLQEEHTKMLADLHKELETVKCKNRELQFQLLLGQHVPVQPPGGAVAHLAELTPGEAEELGAEIKELQASLHEARSRNVYLSNMLEKQEQKLKQLEEEREAVSEAKMKCAEKEAQEPETSTPAVPTELFKKLQRTEDLVAQLKNENRSQREELAELRLSVDQDSRLRYRGCNHPSKRSSSLVRMSPQKTGKLPLLRSRLSRQASVGAKVSGSPSLPQVARDDSSKAEKKQRRPTVRGESVDSKFSRA